MPWWLILIIVVCGMVLLWAIIHIACVIAAHNVSVKPYISEYRTTFPDVESGHVVPTRQRYSYTYDKDFDFRYKTGARKLARFSVRAFILSWFGSLIALPIHGVLVKNKKVFRKYKNLMKNGYITTCNHTFDFDMFAVISTGFPRWPEFPIWKEGAESAMGLNYRAAGGIPLPRDSVRGTYYSMKAMEEVLNEKGWLHIYPEGSCWHFYTPIWEYKPGAFKIAYDTNKPVFPLGMSFRKRRGLSGLFTKAPWATLSIGEPIFADRTLPEKESVKKLADDARCATMRLVGIHSEEENNALKKQYTYVPYIAPFLASKKITPKK